VKIKMTNKRFIGGATVPSDDVPTWEAAGWVAVPEADKPEETPKPTKSKGFKS
jgi:Zn ribbon nucleic-acid-binding protein